MIWLNFWFIWLRRLSYVEGSSSAAAAAAAEGDGDEDVVDSVSLGGVDLSLGEGARGSADGLDEAAGSFDGS
jgi:hypothetical protein